MGKALDLEAVAAELQDWSSQQNLVNEAIASARVSLSNCEQEEIELGLKPVLEYSQILLEFDRQSLIFRSNLSYAYIDTEIGLYLRDESGVSFRGLKQVGHYRLITMLDGQLEDDYLVLDSAYQAQ